MLPDTRFGDVFGTKCQPSFLQQTVCLLFLY